MSKIDLTTEHSSEYVDAVRGAHEHRAIWMYLLLDEMRKAGLDFEKIGRTAMRRCGVWQNEQKLKRMGADDFSAFKETLSFKHPEGEHVFEKVFAQFDDDGAHAENSYCPLVAGWVHYGVADDELKLFCDIVMEADEGVNDVFDNVSFTLKKTIPDGDPFCELQYDRVKK